MTKLTNVRRRISQCLRLEAPGSCHLPPLHPEQPQSESDDDAFVVYAVAVPPCPGVEEGALLRIFVTTAHGDGACEFSWPIHDLMARYKAASGWFAGLASVHRVIGDLLGLNETPRRDAALPAEYHPRPAGLLSPGLVLAHAILIPPRATITLTTHDAQLPRGLPTKGVAVHLEGRRSVRAW